MMMINLVANKRKIILIVFLSTLSIGLGVVLFHKESGKMKATSTPPPYLNTFSVSDQTYMHDTAKVLSCVDSLISVGIITKTDKKTKTYFNGQFYEDSVVREWAIDLPMKTIEYEKHYVDTLIYNPNDPTTFGGILISRVHHKSNPTFVEYLGNGFLCRKRNHGYNVKIYGRRITGSRSVKECSQVLRTIYFNQPGRRLDQINLNDTRYFSTEEFKKVQW
jgi:hypothetical protein